MSAVRHLGLSMDVAGEKRSSEVCAPLHHLEAHRVYPQRDCFSTKPLCFARRACPSCATLPRFSKLPDSPLKGSNLLSSSSTTQPPLYSGTRGRVIMATMDDPGVAAVSRPLT